MPSMEDLLNTINQVMETFLNGANALANADLKGLEALGLFFGASMAITLFKKFIRRRW